MGPASVRRDPDRIMGLYPDSVRVQKMVRRPGIEPGPPAWKAGILTTELTTRVNVKMRPPGIEPGSPRPQRGVLPLNQRRFCSVKNHVPVAQWLRRVTTNHEIGGSSPSRNVSF